MNRRFGGVVVGGLLAALAVAAAGAFGHVGGAAGSSRSTTYALVVLAVLALAGAVSLVAHAVAHGEREPARVRARREPADRDGGEGRGRRGD